MTAMDTNAENIPLPAPGPPPPPPPPGVAGAVQLPHWRSEPLPSHLAPTREEIDKEQYAHLPDKLLNTMNKDKKPFTYTPQGASGVDKGKLDLSNIRSPKMKKRLMANLADDEDNGSERVTRSETPDLLSKPQPVTNNRRAITPDVISLSKQTYVPVLPKELPERTQSPNIPRHEPQQKREQPHYSIPQEKIEDFLNKTSFLNMQEIMREAVQRPELKVQNENVERVAPIKHENTQQEVFKPKLGINENDSTNPDENNVNRLDSGFVSRNNDYNPLPEESKQNFRQTNGNNGRDDNRISDSYDNRGNRNKTDIWESDLLRHVLEGGLQEEIEKFEQISLETEDSLNQNRGRSSQNDNYSENYSRSPQSMPTWSPPNYIQNPYIQPQSPFGSLNRRQQSSPQPSQAPQWSGQQYWSERASPSPQSLYQHNSPANNAFGGGHIPSKTFQYKKTGINDAEVPNYNSRPKPFYLCSPPPTPTATPPPQFLYQPKQPQTTTFGNKVPPQKIDYHSDLCNSAIASTPKTRYMENSKMYAQTPYYDQNMGNSGIRSPDPYKNRGVRTPDPFMNSGIRSPDIFRNSGVRSPEPPMSSGTYDPRLNTDPNLRKKLPPSEAPPDPTPSKYMGANIPSRSFRFLQLMTGEDIENQYSAGNQNDFKRNIKPNTSYSNTPRSSGYSSINDSGTDF